MSDLIRDTLQSMPFSAALPDPVLDLPAQSSVGRRIVRLCEACEGPAAMFTDFGEQEAFTLAVVTQCEVWLLEFLNGKED
jgi:hypothetical protein